MWVVRKLKKLIGIPQCFEYTTWRKKEHFVIEYLKQWNPKLRQDEKGNLFIINPGTPLLCAHMDTVQTLTQSNHSTNPSNMKIVDWILSTGMCMWADDKCWIAIVMQIYEELWDKVSLLFTVWEESWLVGAREFVKKFPKTLDSCTYCVIPDRMWWWDIIWRTNDYCSFEFQTEVKKIMSEWWYNPVRWVCCDANAISEILNCVNISCWYMNHHKDTEYVDLTEFYSAYVWIYNLLIQFNTKMPTYQQQIEIDRAKSNPINLYNNWHNNINKNKVNRRGDLDILKEDKKKEKEDDDESMFWIMIGDDDIGELFINSKKGILIVKSQTQLQLVNDYNQTIDIPKGKYRFLKDTNPLDEDNEYDGSFRNYWY